MTNNLPLLALPHSIFADKASVDAAATEIVFESVGMITLKTLYWVSAACAVGALMLWTMLYRYCSCIHEYRPEKTMGASPCVEEAMVEVCPLT